MKNLLIQVQVDEQTGKISTLVKKFGFSNPSSLEVIGILQNLIYLEQEKISTSKKMTVSKKLGQDSEDNDL
jgi:hypothetical protein